MALIYTFLFPETPIGSSPGASVKQIGAPLLPLIVTLVCVVFPPVVPVFAQPNPPSDTEAETVSPTLPSKTAEDRDMEETLRNVFASVEAFHQIQVSVRRGTVTLTGTVPTPSDRKAAETIADKFDHTLFVDNQINVSDLQQSTKAPWKNKPCRTKKSRTP